VTAACATADTLVALLEGALPPDRAEALDAHVDGCAACAAVVAELGALSGDGPRVVGRYRLERTLGAGAMGVVWAAWDPELQRRIAVKLVRARGGDAASRAAGRARMVREARALARVSHPNVVAVHDVGEHDGEVFVATELVDGDTMAEWQHGRGWREVTLAWVQAARGLAAAHAEGLVHRDVKPANVLVGRDGRVRVGDFGLARTDLTDAPTEDDVGSPSDVAAAASPALARVTATGHVAGTPGYMAPEQRTGPIDARADQFALCVALAEALSGRRPLAGATLAIRDVPAALVAALERGLRVKPGDRFPAIAELADALVAATEASEAPAPVAPPPPRPRRITAGVIALVLGAGTAITVGALRDDGDGDRTPAPVVTPAPDPAPVVAAATPTPTPSPSPASPDAAPPPPSIDAAIAKVGARRSTPPPPAPASASALDPAINGYTLLYVQFTDKVGQTAQAQRDREDGAGCLATLGAAPASESWERVMLRATCEMVDGRCRAGLARLAAIPLASSPVNAPIATMIERRFCPSWEGDLTTRVRRYEAQAADGTRLPFAVDRYRRELLALADDPDLAGVPADRKLSAADGPGVVAKGFIRLVHHLRSIQRCADATELEAKAATLGISVPEHAAYRLHCP
jgi:serine/threonine protein kinase